jgi:hypothetical protein
MRIPYFLRYLTGFLLSISLRSIHHARPFRPRQNCLLVPMVQNAIDLNNNNLGIQRISCLDMPTKQQYLTATVIFYSYGEVLLLPSSMLIIDIMHSPMYLTNTGKNTDH